MNGAHRQIQKYQGISISIEVLSESPCLFFEDAGGDVSSLSYAAAFNFLSKLFLLGILSLYVDSW